jgi:alpha-L-arabinofuranosidase
MAMAGRGAQNNAPDPKPADPASIRVDPSPGFDLSPYLYMQFMEPLGTTDGSVAAAWDHLRDCWRDGFIQASKELSPTLMRLGGCFSSYYRWKEAVGPRDRRRPMLNLLWGGIESNQIGTVEFVDYCRRVGADALVAVNFQSDGRARWMKDPKGSVRTAGADEAADWVDYCNNPQNRARLANGLREPCRVPLWQIGNETSYDRNGFNCETASKKTLEFAKAMRQADPTIKLIGWADSGWGKRMAEVAGSELQYLAFHHMYAPGGANSPLRGNDYRKDPDRTWAVLMDAYKPHEDKIRGMREQVAGSGIPLAMTECHFALPGPNRNSVLSSWACGVSMARLLNVHTRQGDVLKIATAADFCGTRWQNNAIMLDRDQAYMQPVARVMSLYRHHVGLKALNLLQTPPDLDVTASRTDNKVFLHVVNTRRTRAVGAQLAVSGTVIRSGSVFEIAAEPDFEVWTETREVIAPKRKELPQTLHWSFPPASVSAVELEIAS